MALTNTFFEAVKDENIRRVRIMMKDSLLVDPTFTDFNNMNKAAHTMNGLYDSYDNKELIHDKKFWTDEYMDKLMVQVINNFSHERIEHLKDVITHLRPVTKTSDVSCSKKDYYTTNKNIHESASYQERKHQDQQNGDYCGTKIATGIVAGAVVGGVVTSAAGISIVGGVAVGALAGGAVTTVLIKGGKL